MGCEWCMIGQFVYSALAASQRLYLLCTLPGSTLTLIYWSPFPLCKKIEKKGNISECFVTSQYKHSFPLELGSWLGFVLVIFEGITIWWRGLKSTQWKPWLPAVFCIPPQNNFQSTMDKGKRTKPNAAPLKELLQRWYLNPTTNLSLVNRLIPLQTKQHMICWSLEFDALNVWWCRCSQKNLLDCVFVVYTSVLEQLQLLATQYCLVLEESYGLRGEMWDTSKSRGMMKVWEGSLPTFIEAPPWHE